jgi:hypothetical protein
MPQAYGTGRSGSSWGASPPKVLSSDTIIFRQRHCEVRGVTISQSGLEYLARLSLIKLVVPHRMFYCAMVSHEQQQVLAVPSLLL